MSSTYKVLVVDDEHLICEGLYSYDWEQLGFEATGMASNGRQAIDFIENNQVDVVIADIKMPVMDGLEMSKIIRETHPHIKIIILSGYKNFEYARQAIQNSVYDYILKPIDFEKLNDLFSDLKQTLDRERENKRRFKTYKNKLAESLPLAANKFLGNIIEGKLTNLSEIKEKVDIFELNLNDSYFCCGVINFASEKALNREEKKLNDFLRGKKLGYSLVQDNLVYLIFNLETDREEVIKENLDQIRDFLNKDKNYLIGVGNIYENILFLKKSAREALQLCRNKFYRETRKIIYQWTQPEEMTSKKYPYEKEDALLDTMLEGDKQEGVKLFQDYWDELSVKDYIYRHHIIQFLNVMDHRLKEHGTSLEEVSGISPPYGERFKGIRTVGELKKQLQKIITGAIDRVNQLNKDVIDSSYPAIKKALAYIKKNYQEKITLKELSEEVYLNPSYLSVLFKKETGENFIEYLTNYRINRAQKLLKNLDLKVYQVGNRVGYKNRKYFTEIFKKKTGFTPNQYRKKYYSG